MSTLVFKSGSQELQIVFRAPATPYIFPAIVRSSEDDIGWQLILSMAPWLYYLGIAP